MTIYPIFKKFINNRIVATTEDLLASGIKSLGNCCLFSTPYGINRLTFDSLYMKNRSEYMGLKRRTDPMNSEHIKLAFALGGHKDCLQ